MRPGSRKNRGFGSSQGGKIGKSLKEIARAPSSRHAPIVTLGARAPDSRRSAGFRRDPGGVPAEPKTRVVTETFSSGAFAAAKGGHGRPQWENTHVCSHRDLFSRAPLRAARVGTAARNEKARVVRSAGFRRGARAPSSRRSAGFRSDPGGVRARPGGSRRHAGLRRRTEAPRRGFPRRKPAERGLCVGRRTAAGAAGGRCVARRRSASRDATPPPGADETRGTDATPPPSDPPGNPIFGVFYGARGRDRSKPLCIRGVFWAQRCQGEGGPSHAHAKAKSTSHLRKKQAPENARVVGALYNAPRFEKKSGFWLQPGGENWKIP